MGPYRYAFESKVLFHQLDTKICFDCQKKKKKKKKKTISHGKV